MAERFFAKKCKYAYVSDFMTDLIDTKGVAKADITISPVNEDYVLFTYFNDIPVVSTDGSPTVEFEYGTEEPDWTTYVAVTDGDHASGYTLTVDDSAVDMDTVGTFEVGFIATDASGNISDEHTIEITIVDTTIPVITLVGTTADVEYDDIDDWSPLDNVTSVLDGYDGDISADLVIAYKEETSGGSVIADLDDARTYLETVGNAVYVTYNVDDANGNSATEKTATFTSVDTVAPVITLTATTINVEASDVATWTPADNVATATDNVDGDLSGSVTYTYTKDDAEGDDLTDLAGARTWLGTEDNVVFVQYDVDDSAGNSATTVTATFTAVADPE